MERFGIQVDHVHLVTVVLAEVRGLRHRREDQGEHGPRDPPALPLSQEDALGGSVLIGGLRLVHRRHRGRGHHPVYRVPRERGHRHLTLHLGFGFGSPVPRA